MVACKYCKYYKIYLVGSCHVCTYNPIQMTYRNPIDGRTACYEYANCREKNMNNDCKDYVPCGFIKMLYRKFYAMIGGL